MHRLMPLMIVLGLGLLAAPPAHAQSRTYVSGLGDDVNSCSRSSPCKTFAGVIGKTALHGEINCLDDGGFGTVVITKSITINCHGHLAGILNVGTNAINILFDSFPATDTRKTVRLRNLTINGVATGAIGINIIGATNAANSAVFIDDCLIDGMYAGPMRGISDTRNGGGLWISNTTVRNIGGTAISVAPVGGSSPFDVLLDQVRVQRANIGIAVARPARMLINRAVVSGHTTGGIEVDGAEVNINDSTISNNGVGVRAGGGTVRLSNNDISFNRTGVGGATTSFGNNRISGNGSAGTAPTPAGPISNELGQQ